MQFVWQWFNEHLLTAIVSGLIVAAFATFLSYWFSPAERINRLRSRLVAWWNRPPPEPYVRLLIADLDGDNEAGTYKQNLEKAFSRAKGGVFKGFKVELLNLKPWPESGKEQERIEGARETIRQWLDLYDADLCLYGSVTPGEKLPYHLYFASKHEENLDDEAILDAIGLNKALKLPRELTGKLRRHLALTALAVLTPPTERFDQRERYFERFLEPRIQSLERLANQVVDDLGTHESATIYRSLGRACLNVVRTRKGTPRVQEWIERAKEHLTKAADRFQSVNAVDAHAHTLCDLGNAYVHDPAALDTAESYFQQALDCGSNDESVFWRAQTGLAEADLEAGQGSDETGHDHCIDRLQRIYKRIPQDREPLRLHRALRILGNAYTKRATSRDDKNSARRGAAALRWAQRLLDRGTQPVLWAQVTSNYAEAASCKARLNMDPVHCRDATKIARQALSVLDDASEPWPWYTAQITLSISLTDEMYLTSELKNWDVRDAALKAADRLLLHGETQLAGSSQSTAILEAGRTYLMAWQILGGDAILHKAIAAFEQAEEGLVGSGNYNEAVLRQHWALALYLDPTRTTYKPLQQAVEHAEHARELFLKWGNPIASANCDELIDNARARIKAMGA